MSSSVGRIIIYGKIKFMFQTTNQTSVCFRGYWNINDLTSNFQPSTKTTSWNAYFNDNPHAVLVLHSETCVFSQQFRETTHEKPCCFSPPCQADGENGECCCPSILVSNMLLPTQKSLPEALEPMGTRQICQLQWKTREKHMVIGSRTIWNGGFYKWGVPKNGWLIMDNPIKMHDLGVPLF
jgi:hypothetical protein